MGYLSLWVPGAVQGPRDSRAEDIRAKDGGAEDGSAEDGGGKGGGGSEEKFQRKLWSRVRGSED